MNWQVVNQGLCEKLKALGIIQRSLFHWSISGELLIQQSSASFDVVGSPGDFVSSRSVFCSAFSVAELMVALPDGFFLRKHLDGWVCVGLGVPWTENDEPLQQEAERIADAPGKMLVYLLKKKLIPVSSVNERMGAV